VLEAFDLGTQDEVAGMENPAEGLGKFRLERQVLPPYVKQGNSHEITG
jgi:hypothetical protein